MYTVVGNCNTILINNNFNYVFIAIASRAKNNTANCKEQLKKQTQLLNLEYNNVAKLKENCSMEKQG